MAFNPKYEVNINKIINRLYGDREYEMRRRIRETASQEFFKLDFGLLAIDRIVARSRDGIDKNGKAFAEYSESYKKSLAFRVSGKSSNVNLTLTGEMLASMTTVPTDSGFNIEMIDQRNRSKAHGIITGQQGKWKAKRDFLGLPEKEENEIFKDLLAIHHSDAGASLETLRELFVGLDDDFVTAGVGDIGLLASRDMLRRAS